jgi:uncharacterized SAM-binding protein YcdF (DUF218 family)
LARPNPTKSRRHPAPARKIRLRITPFRLPGGRNWLKPSAYAAIALVIVLIAWGAIARQLAPTSNTSLTHFDAIIVLGSPADNDGNPTPTQLARVTEAVHEYQRGVATRLILTGGAVANQFTEARVMARTAHAHGIPDSAIFVEPDARNTIQNACYAVRIMKAHGWTSAEVVSSPYHLPRAGLIFSRLPLEWRTHAAPPLTPSPQASTRAAAITETLKTVRYLVWTRQFDRCEP